MFLFLFLRPMDPPMDNIFGSILYCKVDVGTVRSIFSTDLSTGIRAHFCVINLNDLTSCCNLSLFTRVVGGR